PCRTFHRLAPLWQEGYSLPGPERNPRLQVDAPRVEAGRVELCPELLDRAGHVLGEQVLDDPDLDVVVPRDVDVLVRDEIHGCSLAGRAPDGEADRPGPRRQQEARRGEPRPRTLLRVA